MDGFFGGGPAAGSYSNHAAARMRELNARHRSKATDDQRDMAILLVTEGLKRAWASCPDLFRVDLTESMLRDEAAMLVGRLCR